MRYTIEFTCYIPNREFELQAASPILGLLGEYLVWLKHEYKHPHMLVMFRGCKFKTYENEANLLEIGYFGNETGNKEWSKLITKFKELEDKYK